MKYLLVVFFILISLSGITQSLYPTPYNKQGSTGTAISNDGGYFINGVLTFPHAFADTFTANLTRARLYPASHITVGNTDYLRSSDTLRWVAVGTPACPPNGLVEPIGSATWTGTGLDFNVTACYFYFDCRFHVTSPALVTLTPADATFNRIDVIGVDSTDNVFVSTGTPSVNPQPNSINPLSQIQLTFVYIPAGSTVPGGQTQTIIYNENVEWTPTSDVSGIDFASTSSPCYQSLATVSPTMDSAEYISFQNGSTLNINNQQYLKFRYKKLSSFSPVPSTGIVLSFYHGSTQISEEFTLVNGAYGYDETLVDSCQLIVIPLTGIVTSDSLFDKLYITNNGAVPTFQLDYIYLLEGASVPPVISNSWVRSGNAGINDATEYVGTSDAKKLNFGTNGQIRAYIDTSGIDFLNDDTTQNILIIDPVTKKISKTYFPTLFASTCLQIFDSVGKRWIRDTCSNGSSSGWGLDGNAITAGQFLGTTNDEDLVFKRNGIEAGRIGAANTSFGAEALVSATTAQFNTAIGSGMYSLETGLYNTSVGADALALSVSGNMSTAIGADALLNSIADSNTAVGAFSIPFLTTGTGNIAIGVSNGYSLIDGVCNIIIGQRADVATASTDSSIALGFKATAATKQFAISPYITQIKTPGITGALTAGNVLTTDGTGIATFQPPAGTGSVLTGNLTYVDAINGNDGTAVLGDFTKPFLTLGAAVTAATPGYTIVVRPGSYSITDNLAKDSVDWYFYPNTNVSMTQDVDSTGIWDDGGTEMHFLVTGAGKFTRTTTDEFLKVNVINVSHPSSVISIQADELITQSGTDGESTVINQHDGNLTVNARNISAESGTNVYTIWWFNGTLNVNAQKIYSTYACIASSVSSTPTGDAHITANEIQAGPTGTGVGVVSTLGLNSDAAIWVHANIIRATIQSSGINKVYVESQKIFGNINTYGSAGLVYVTTDKITDNGSGVLSINAGTVRLNVDHIDAGINTAAMDVISGELQLNNANYISSASSVGLTVSGGIAKLTDCNFTTTANSGTSPIIKSGGTLTIRDCILVAESTATSISAPTSQTVISYNSFANKALDVDVTINGILTVGSYVQ